MSHSGRPPLATGVAVAALLAAFGAGCSGGAPEDPGGAARVDLEADGSAPLPRALQEWIERAEREIGAPTVAPGAVAGLPDDLVVIDVREAREIAVSRLEGALALDSDDDRAGFLAQDDDRPVLVYCTVGWRSAKYAAELAALGRTAYNLRGGLCGWAAAGLPLVDDQGQVTRAIHAYSDAFADCVPGGFEPIVD
jgi:rhodanese-related sulfurtransferase